MDNCYIKDTVISKTDFDCSNIGTPVTVNVTLIDESGNQVTEQAIITVADNIVRITSYNVCYTKLLRL